jgi:hypothetical protein
MQNFLRRFGIDRRDACSRHVFVRFDLHLIGSALSEESRFALGLMIDAFLGLRAAR